MVPVYQKAVYYSSGASQSILNIKRLFISVAALTADENWYFMLEYDGIKDYSLFVEIRARFLVRITLKIGENGHNRTESNTAHYAERHYPGF